MTTGDHFRGYVIERQLGKGGLGSVYLVRHEILDTPYALKILDPAVATDKPEYVKRFVREGKLASRIRHPNLVAVHDAGFDDERGVYFLVMDYVQGSTLRQIIALGGKIQEKEAVRIIASVASVLAAAAKVGMVHRDIKPENIMLMPDDTVKLIDLGVAKASGEIDSLRTMAKTVLGTPGYMSPEQAADSSTVDARSDIYSLGIVFFEMLCGRSPYNGNSPEAILKELFSSAPIPDVRTYNPEVSIKLAAVISLMCAKRADDRLKSSAELLDTFKRLGYSIPDAKETWNEAPADEGGEPFSYQFTAESSSNTLSFDTKDEEIKKFVAELKRKRTRKRIQRIVIAVAALGAIVAVMAAILR